MKNNNTTICEQLDTLWMYKYDGLGPTRNQQEFTQNSKYNPTLNPRDADDL